MSFKTGPASVAGRPVAKPLQLGLQRSDSRLGSSAGLRLSLHPRLGKGGAEFRLRLAHGLRPPGPG